jgi:RNA-directed DNA polymerase
MVDRGRAPDKQLPRPVAPQRGEASGGASGECPPGHHLRERVGERSHLVRALARVRANGGSPGSDGMTVEEWPADLRQHGPPLRASRLAGASRPSPVKRVELPKPGGGVRKRGRPTVRDRLLPQALLQVLPPAGEKTLSEGSEGFRPGRSAPQALGRAQASLEAGYRWGVDRERATFFDRVNQDKVLSVVQERVRARRVGQLLDRYLQAGALEGDSCEATTAGTPQGGPRSPLLATLLLDGLDKELERRGPRVVRFADGTPVQA